MTAERWIVVRNWERFQHYRDRDPVWIKLYVALSGDPDWERLTLAQRGVLVGVWIEYARRRGVVAESSLRRSEVHTENDARRYREHLETLIEAGFLEVSASRPLAIGYPRERGRVRDREETPPTPSQNEGDENGTPRTRGTNPRAVAKRSKEVRHAELVDRARREISTWDETRTDILHDRLDALEHETGAILSDQERADVIDEFLASVWDETVETEESVSWDA